MDLDKLANYLDRKDVEYWDIFYEEKEVFQMVLRNGEIEEQQKNKVKGIGIRVLVNGVVRYFSTENMSETNIIKEIDEIVRTPGKGDCKFEEPSDIKDEYTIQARFPEYPLNELKELTQFLTKDRIKQVIVSYFYEKGKTVFLNSYGAEIIQPIPRNKIYYKLTAREGGRLENIHNTAYSLGDSVLEKLSEEDMEKDIKAVNALLKAEYPKPGRYDIVIDERVSGVLAHEAYGHALEADHIQYKQSVLWNRFGEHIGNFTLVDNPEITGYGHYRYDDEGIPGKERLLIKEGILQEKIEDMRFGKGGSGRRESYEHNPIPRMSNTYFLPGDFSDEELFSEVKTGYFLIGVSGGQVDTTGGTFQFDCTYCYEIKNGELRRICKGTVFVGNILSTGKQIAALGKKIKLHGGTCGKEKQGVPVGDGGPKILVKNAKLGGV